VQRFFVSEPMGVTPLIPYKGDVLICTTSSLVSTRDLFTKGSALAEEEALTAPIYNRWLEVCSQGAAYPVQGVWDERKNRLVIACSLPVGRRYTLTDSPIFMFLVYDVATKSWAEHSAASVAFSTIRQMVYYGSTVRWITDNFGIAAVVEKGTKTNYTDDYIADPAVSTIAQVNYQWEILTAPLPLSSALNSRITNVELLIKSDAQSHTLLNLVGDLGRVATAAAGVGNQGALVTKPSMSLGIDSSVVQLALYSPLNVGPLFTLSTGLEIYGINILYEQGGMR
jgi:hypothetical protein